jgi:ribonuclease D
MAYELIAARADLERIVRAQRDGLPEPDTRTLQGWRRKLVGEEVLELLAGRRSLRVGEGRAIEISDH